jgi:hypothetical protein
MLYEEVNRLRICSLPVKHGMFAGQQSLPSREITVIYLELEAGTTSVDAGLQKIMLLAQNHLPLYNAAKILRNLLHGADEEQSIKIRMTSGGHY